MVPSANQSIIRTRRASSIGSGHGGDAATSTTLATVVPAVSASDDRGDLAAHALADQHARSGPRDDRPHRIDHPGDVA
ncbi:hypothetical protein ASE57_02950 [Sphingomonas sp. Leaf11]|nr:hypothetical protein ASE58_02960 [Sphingomonas sp. Leaf9]KQM45533.1 hypothetical protein ASE57_02950 [Sphingomonas sp. Leaf11]